MGLLFLILFLITEIALTVLTFTKWYEKAKFLRNRTVVTAAEFLILLLIVVIPMTYMKWRFTCALVMLLVRSVFAGIRFLLKGKKVQGNVNKPARIICCVFSVMFLGISLMPSFIFSNYNGLEVTGEYEIGECSAILIDSRIEEFENDGSKREVPVHFYYPEAEGEFPLVVFSHGAFGYYQSNYSTYAELASNGYVVVALDHPYHAFFTKDSQGKTIIVDMEFMTDAVDISNGNMSESEAMELSREWMNLRTADQSFVLDTIKFSKESDSLGDNWFTDNETEILKILSRTDTEKIGLMGHSMGGATAVALGRNRDDIDAVIDLDGSMLSEIKSINNGECVYVSDPYKVPLLDFRKESDYNELEQLRNNNTHKDSYIYGFAYVNNYIVENAQNAQTVVFHGAEHMDFTDLPMFSPFLGSLLGTGDVNSEEFMYMVNAIVLNWFDYYLKGEGTLNIQAIY